MKRRFIATELSPVRLYLMLLLTVFSVELGLMLLLPALPLGHLPQWGIGLIDAGILTLVLVPVFAVLIVGPLRHMARIRVSLFEQFIAVQEEERTRIARDLHDEIGQSFTSILMGLRRLNDLKAPAENRARLEEMVRVVSDSIEEVRRLARGLRPAALDHVGLAGAIEQYLEEFRRTYEIDVALERACPGGDRRFPPAIETAVYRIVQEALTNVARHAKATWVRVGLHCESSRLRVEVLDNGNRGEFQQSSAGSLGAQGMAERAALLHGKLTIEVVPAGGTRVLLSVPLPGASD